MIDALGLAETTPGAAYPRDAVRGPARGLCPSRGPMGGLAAGLVALWVTFTPCFLWIFPRRSLP